MYGRGNPGVGFGPPITPPVIKQLLIANAVVFVAQVATMFPSALLAASPAVGVVIPTVPFNLGGTRFADARAMIDAGAALALTTDINPGSAPCPSMPLAMAIACRYQRLLPAEALVAATLNAAHAVSLSGSSPYSLSNRPGGQPPSMNGSLGP